MPVNCWGPSVGAKAVSYRTAVILGLIGQAIGMVAFGPDEDSPYGGLLDHRDQLTLYPPQVKKCCVTTIPTIGEQMLCEDNKLNV